MSRRILKPIEPRGLAVPDGHRERLVTTIREVAMWRRGKAWQFEDPGVQRDNRRAANTLRTLANFVVGLPDDDPDLWALAHSPVRGEGYELCREALGLLSRFGLHRGTFVGKATPEQVQFRNLLRRIEGQERHARIEAQRGARCEEPAGTAFPHPPHG